MPFSRKGYVQYVMFVMCICVKCVICICVLCVICICVLRCVMCICVHVKCLYYCVRHNDFLVSQKRQYFHVNALLGKYHLLASTSNLKKCTFDFPAIKAFMNVLSRNIPSWFETWATISVGNEH